MKPGIVWKSRVMGGNNVDFWEMAASHLCDFFESALISCRKEMEGLLPPPWTSFLEALRETIMNVTFASFNMFRSLIFHYI